MVEKYSEESIVNMVLNIHRNLVVTGSVTRETAAVSAYVTPVHKFIVSFHLKPHTQY